jgi:hypothetical protein
VPMNVPVDAVKVITEFVRVPRDGVRVSGDCENEKKAVIEL